MKVFTRKIKHIIMAVCLLLVLFPAQYVQAAAYENETDVPIFMVGAYDDELNVQAFTAFYVQDIQESGATYLITDSIVERYIDKGYTLAVMAENYYSKVRKVYTDGCISYLMVEDTDGLSAYQPIPLAAEVVQTDCSMGYLNITDDEHFELIMEEGIDFSNWSKEGEYYNSGLVEGTDVEMSEINMLLGMPVMTKDWQVMGVMVLNGYNDNVVIQDLTVTEFLSNAVIVSGTGQENGNVTDSTETDTSATETEEPGTETNSDEEKKSKGMPVMLIAGIIGAVIVAVVVVIVIKKKKDNTANAGTDTGKLTQDDDAGLMQADEIGLTQADDVGLTQADDIGLTQADDIGKTQAFFTDSNKTEAVSKKWQLRGMSGRFQGEIFEIQGTMRFGRDVDAEISYPRDTRGISGSHCEVREEFEKIVLIDLQSSFGTFFGNGAKLEPKRKYELKEGDTFYLADQGHTFRLEKFGETREQFSPAVRSVVYPQKDTIYRAGPDEHLNFGRSPRSQVPFTEADQSISSNHCVLYRENGRVYLMDMGSSNGTFMGDGTELKPHVPYPVKRGDAFSLASKKYTFVIVEE